MDDLDARNAERKPLKYIFMLIGPGNEIFGEVAKLDAAYGILTILD